MKTTLFALAFLATSSLASPMLASGTHGGGHEAMSIGQPGDAKNATQTVRVTMKETDDGKMIFTPASIKVRQGQTVRFALKNVGELEHEFVLDDKAQIQEHKVAMEKFPDMEHADANAIRLEPGKSGEIVWTFTNTGTFEFACLVPGHYDAGMHGPLEVVKK
ncbi:plastocyanin/azurin family copper-binding protein [Ensifer sp.]|uniref:cupredoxin domain-containing protein n=1 Tax=Ensifer sp. TaxID=1872086 RepID=UPI000DD908A5|nr:plastocyanin/azurin family copper-binding protein [Ensifer sp.]